jgi:hypothetical protein|tara:strand:+ start:376 stop:528 length:153 start_codon:yes stop_codon:yes gene_type:complete
MSKSHKGSIGLTGQHVSKKKKTSIGNNHSMRKSSTLNKHKSYKRYRGQGK